MTKREIKDLDQHNQETKTYYVHYEGYGFHGTNLNTVVEQLNIILCQMPGCGNARCRKDGRLGYLCPNHFAEACEVDRIH